MADTHTRHTTKYAIQKCVAILATGGGYTVVQCTAHLHSHSHFVAIYIFVRFNVISIGFAAPPIFISFVFVYSATAANLLFDICFAIFTIGFHFSCESDKNAIHTCQRTLLHIL